MPRGVKGTQPGPSDLVESHDNGDSSIGCRAALILKIYKAGQLVGEL